MVRPLCKPRPDAGVVAWGAIRTRVKVAARHIDAWAGEDEYPSMFADPASSCRGGARAALVRAPEVA